MSSKIVIMIICLILLIIICVVTDIHKSLARYISNYREISREVKDIKEDIKNLPKIPNVGGGIMKATPLEGDRETGDDNGDFLIEINERDGEDFLRKYKNNEGRD